MPFKSQLNLKGFDEYLAKVAQAGADIDEVADEALRAGGEILVDGMWTRAPERSGNLKRHIKMIGPTRDGNFHSIKVGVFDVDRPKELYFFYNEWGTATTPAHPYIRPTLEEDWKRALAEIKRVLVSRGTI